MTFILASNGGWSQYDQSAKLNLHSRFSEIFLAHPQVMNCKWIKSFIIMNLNDFACLAKVLNVEPPNWNALNVYHLNFNQQELENICCNMFEGFVGRPHIKTLMGWIKLIFEIELNSLIIITFRHNWVTVGKKCDQCKYRSQKFLLVFSLLSVTPLWLAKI